MKPSLQRTALIIGAGHNGLVCAFYLARAGFLQRPDGSVELAELEPAQAPGDGLEGGVGDAGDAERDHGHALPGRGTDQED